MPTQELIRRNKMKKMFAGLILLSISVFVVIISCSQDQPTSILKEYSTSTVRSQIPY